jgi:adenosylcobinamide-phosphate synthase
MSALALLVGLLLDRRFGEPDWLWRHVPHPIVAMGALVSMLDRRLNGDKGDPQRQRWSGIAAVVVLVGTGTAVGLAVAWCAALLGPLAIVVDALVIAVLLAQKSLADHVGQVGDGLRAGGLQGGRAAVAMIVGRDPQTLDEPGVCRAAIESLAENSSDGVVAPALWYLMAGLPGIIVYKLVNTADSMIGNRSPRHVDFGRAAARFDDAMNWAPARLTAALIAITVLLWHGGRRARTVAGVVARDARLHRSPNSGWPESGFAGALGLALSGPRIYGSDIAKEPFLNASGRREATAIDIDRAIKLFWQMCSLGTGLVAVAATLFILC